MFYYDLDMKEREKLLTTILTSNISFELKENEIFNLLEGYEIKEETLDKINLKWYNMISKKQTKQLKER